MWRQTVNPCCSGAPRSPHQAALLLWLGWALLLLLLQLLPLLPAAVMLLPLQLLELQQARRAPAHRMQQQLWGVGPQV
jgi:hypothetical protein